MVQYHRRFNYSVFEFPTDSTPTIWECKEEEFIRKNERISYSSKTKHYRDKSDYNFSLNTIHTKIKFLNQDSLSHALLTEFNQLIHQKNEN